MNQGGLDVLKSVITDRRRDIHQNIIFHGFPAVRKADHFLQGERFAVQIGFDPAVRIRRPIVGGHFRHVDKHLLDLIILRLVRIPRHGEKHC